VLLDDGLWVTARCEDSALSSDLRGFSLGKGVTVGRSYTNLLLCTSVQAEQYGRCFSCIVGSLQKCGLGEMHGKWFSESLAISTLQRKLNAFVGSTQLFT